MRNAKDFEKYVGSFDDKYLNFECDVAAWSENHIHQNNELFHRLNIWALHDGGWSHDIVYSVYLEDLFIEE